MLVIASEVAEALQIHSKTLRRWFDKGLLKGRLIGKGNYLHVELEDARRLCRDRGSPLDSPLRSKGEFFGYGLDESDKIEVERVLKRRAGTLVAHTEPLLMLAEVGARRPRMVIARGLSKDIASVVALYCPVVYWLEAHGDDAPVNAAGLWKRIR